MRRSRFTEEQIIGILKESVAGTKVGELVRKHGISEHTFYRWKVKYPEAVPNVGFPPGEPVYSVR